EVIADIGERLDGGHRLLQRFAIEPHQAASMKRILASGQLRIEAHAELEYGGDPAGNLNAAFRRPHRPRHQLEQRALAGTVLSDDGHGLAWGDREFDITKHPLLGGRLHRRAQPRQNPLPLGPIGAKGLAEARYRERTRTHSASTISPLARRNKARAAVINSTATAATQARAENSGGRSKSMALWKLCTIAVIGLSCNRARTFC